MLQVFWALDELDTGSSRALPYNMRTETVRRSLPSLPRIPAPRLSVRFALLGLLALSPAWAADPAEEAYAPPRDDDDASVLVFVSDPQGQPVAGLSEQDFELYQDGKPSEILYFWARSGDPSARPAAVEAEARKWASPAEQGGSTVALFVDRLRLNTAPSRKRAQAAIQEMMDRPLKPERYVLAIYDGKLKIRILAPGDAAGLAAVLTEIGEECPEGLVRKSRRLTQLRDIEYIALPRELVQTTVAHLTEIVGDRGTALENVIRVYARSQQAETDEIVAALDETVATLAGLPGRKALVCVTGGFQMQPVESVLRALEGYQQPINSLRHNLARERFDNSDELRRLFTRANASGVTVYGLAMVDDLSGNAQAGRLLAPELYGAQKVQQVDALSQFSQSTGGAFALSANDQSPLFTDLAHDASVYYVLGVVPKRDAAGRPGKIEVKVRRPGLKVRARDSAPSRTGIERTRDRTLAALLLDTASNPLNASVEWGAESRTPKGEVQVEMTVKLPMAGLTFHPGESFHEANLRVFIGRIGDDGHSRDLTEVAVPIRLPHDQLQTALGQTAAYKTTLVFSPGPHRVAIGVRDELGEDDSTLRVDFTPQPQELAEKPVKSTP
jgi:VWFA-related protein